jgi:hypothetical protein
MMISYRAVWKTLAGGDKGKTSHLYRRPRVLEVDDNLVKSRAMCLINNCSSLN